MIINKLKTIKEALGSLQIITSTQVGIRPCLFVINESKILLGTVTDGDIRRYLLKGKLEDPIINAANKSFKYLLKSSSAFEITAKLDISGMPIPILNDEGKLLRIEYPFNHSDAKNKNKSYQSTSPLRVSFLGGGLDSSEFLKSYKQKILFAPLSLSVHVFVKSSERNSIRIGEWNSPSNIKLKNLNLLDVPELCRMPLAALKYFNHNVENFGIETDIISSVEPGSGLGASSAILLSFIKAYSSLANIIISEKDLPAVGYRIERLLMDLPGGWQDHFAPLAKGISMLNFSPEKVDLIPIDLNETFFSLLSDSTIFFKTNFTRPEEMPNLSSLDDIKVSQLIDKSNLNIENALSFLLKGDIENFGLYIQEQWRIKNITHKKLIPQNIKKAIEEALKLGAYGGKLLGRGMSGYIMIIAPIKSHKKIIEAVELLNFKLENIKIIKRKAYLI